MKIKHGTRVYPTLRDASLAIGVSMDAIKIAMREGYKKGYPYGELLGRRISVYKESDLLLVGHVTHRLGGWA